MTLLSFLGLFLPGLLLASFLPLHAAVLSCAGIVFYLANPFGNVRILGFLLVGNYAGGFLSARLQTHPKLQKLWACLLVLGNLFSLAAVFVWVLPSEMIWTELPCWLAVSVPPLHGISYQLSLLWHQSSVGTPVEVCAYLCGFPGALCGMPLSYEKWRQVLAQRRRGTAQFSRGCSVLIKGLFKLAVLSDRLFALWQEFETAAPGSVLAAWLRLTGFVLGWYSCLSGLCDLSSGIGLMLGYEFPVQFSHPLAAQSVTEFCRHWCSALTVWLREHLLRPIVRGRNGTFRVVYATVLLWLLCGLWYGMPLTGIWGVYLAVFILLERYILFRRRDIRGVPALLYTNLVLFVGWSFFSASSLSDAVSTVLSLFGASGCLTDSTGFYLLRTYGAWVVLGWLSATRLPRLFYASYMRKHGHSLLCQLGLILFQTMALLLSLIWILG